ncbi:MAG: endonuclease/exonuclease/phosphatase family protein [Chloroflexi bacterium]|nr:endonuclease/exonuclease/phosphatase family protein [Chloroflexota bacterium]
MKTLGRLWAGLAVFYLLVLAALAVASLVAQATEARGLFASLLSLLSFAAIVLLPLGLLLGRPRLALLMLLPVLVLVLSYGPLFRPRAATAPDNSFTVLTFNIQIAARNPESVAQVIREADADIVAVQELGQPPADYFQANLTDLYPHQAVYPQQDAYAGQAILSRFPILSEEYWRDPETANKYGHLRADLDLNGTTLTVFSTHPVPPVSFEDGLKINAHGTGIDRVLERARAVAGPVVLVGDFNMTDQFDEYHQITQHFTDAFRAVGQIGFGFTFPAEGPMPPILRLDYVFYNAGVQGVSAEVYPRTGTADHHPLRARLSLAANPASGG